MKVVLAAAGSRGDAAPFAALAEALVARGHEVRVITHASLAPALPDGLDIVPVESDPDELISGPAGQALRRGDVRALNRTRNHFAEFLHSFSDPTRASLDDADVLVASTFAVAAVDEALTQEVPVVRAHMWPELDVLDGPMPLLPYAWHLPRGVRRGMRGALRRVEPYFAGVEGGWIDGRLDLHGHHPVGLTTATLGSLFAYSPLVDPVPTTVEDAWVTGWWQAPAGEVSQATSALLDSGDRWIAVGFGSMHQGSPARVVDVVARACRALGVRAVLQLPGAPADPSGTVVTIGDEPHDALFRRVAAVVHHGGSGTTGAAVTAGVPSVVVPHFADQYHWAHRLDALGVAPTPLPRRVLTAGLLARRLREALGDETTSRARELGEQVRRENGAMTAALRLEQLMGAEGRHVQGGPA